MDKLYIKSEDLLEIHSSLLGMFMKRFVPNYIVGVWRGGAPIGIAVQEF